MQHYTDNNEKVPGIILGLFSMLFCQQWELTLKYLFFIIEFESYLRQNGFDRIDIFCNAPIITHR